MAYLLKLIHDQGLPFSLLYNSFSDTIFAKITYAIPAYQAEPGVNFLLHSKPDRVIFARSYSLSQTCLMTLT